jgi:hypothetical protein
MVQPADCRCRTGWGLCNQVYLIFTGQHWSCPLVKVLLEGTADSRIEHYGVIGSNAVWAGLRVPTNGMDPSLLNGFRPYGKNPVMVSLVID